MTNFLLRTAPAKVFIRADTPEFHVRRRDDTADRYYNPRSQPAIFVSGSRHRSTPIPPFEAQRKLFVEAQNSFRGGDLTSALDICLKGLAQFPGDANLMCAAARANLALRRFDDAKDQLDRAIDAFPGFATAHDLMGDLHLLKGDFSEAIAAFEESLRLNPLQKHARSKIGKAKELMEQGAVSPFEGVAGAGRLLRAQMAHAGEIRRAEQHERDGELKEAEAIYRDILKKDPDHVEASRLLAGIAVGYEQFREASVFLKHALELAPDYPRAWVDLANVQRELEEYDEALQSAARLIELSPEKAESYMVYASILGVAGRHEEAIETYETALRLNPDKAAALCTMAHHLKTIGRQEEAISRYRECIAKRPEHSESYWSLANLKTFRFEESEVEAMHRLLESKKLSDEARSQINNALGLEYEARGDYDRAFDHFAECNRVRRSSEFYDPVDTEDTHDRVIELFNREFFEQEAGEERSPAPIFIVGLPRSGSTLIEQILASHSQVDGTHELTDLSRVVRAMRRRKRKDIRFPEVVSRLKPAGWSRIGAQYLERTEKHRSRAPYFIDKNPNNFIFVGLLKLAIPNAKIINARRHPLDSCLGSFKQLFASGQPFSYEMTELAEYYLQYQRLMDHWHEVLPGFVLDVRYEEVVADLDQQVHRLLEFCGLPFEESCLRFHETRRAVKTASSEQVRKPIYSTSVNLWRNYEHRLEPFIEVLEPLLRNLPETERPKL